MKSSLNNTIHIALALISMLCMMTYCHGQSKFDVDAFIKSAVNIEKSDIGDGITENRHINKTGAYLVIWLDKNQKVVSRYKGATHLLIVPGPKKYFVRKAWLTQKGDILEEERRSYDKNGRLTAEGIIDPVTGIYTVEFRHRYSKDGLTQHTTEYANGIQKGPEKSQRLDNKSRD